MKREAVARRPPVCYLKECASRIGTLEQDLVELEKEVEGASEASIARFLTAARKAARLQGKVNVLITTSRKMQRLNKQFRAKDKPTDVLSFPAPPEMAKEFAGDIAISAQIASSNARAFGFPAAVELKILVLHGVLHLARYDHEKDNGEMARKEKKLRRALKLPEALIERTMGNTRVRTAGQHAKQEARV